ncbi:uncharacterized protein MICPUCDRAFT_51388 [Micromonas pusilla CCMP1545]|jgi:hypothetical protein|uniref:Predicted protein n=1 Tax=Micromonas pusilla (strain CCMP1545) TaxID=564608 RepID=C1N1F9_MICPC|nr:uncharacterized protein MICPUCDRAFT_51388 [Micromonas pusilla CCMP1545]EEH54187.1 predicted protein [Micromonas pusilla CCMP1545]|eukprot:XP_003061557.1 predicted protein [Micromonas pusilla CCMP1545]
MIDHLDPPVNVSPDATSDEHENHENHHGEDDPDEARRLRRVKSNRESARRSRARKQQRLVELERSTRVLDDDVRRTRQNVALMSSVMYHVVEENRQLESECAAIGRQILAMNEQAVAKARADAIAQGAMARRGGGTTTTGTGASGGAGAGMIGRVDSPKSPHRIRRAPSLTVVREEEAEYAFHAGGTTSAA